jgi:hypothetical protein
MMTSARGSTRPPLRLSAESYADVRVLAMLLAGESPHTLS